MAFALLRLTAVLAMPPAGFGRTVAHRSIRRRAAPATAAA
jgi:hypothetical protein